MARRAAAAAFIFRRVRSTGVVAAAGSAVGPRVHAAVAAGHAGVGRETGVRHRRHRLRDDVGARAREDLPRGAELADDAGDMEAELRRGLPEEIDVAGDAQLDLTRAVA